MKLVCGITTKNEDWIIKKTLSVLTNFCDKIKGNLHNFTTEIALKVFIDSI